MFTTAALIRSVTSAKFTTVEGGDPDAGRMRAGDADRDGAVDTTGVGVTSPARINPTRKATAELKTSVTMVKRLDKSVVSR